MIQTKRLIIKPLSYCELLKYIANDHSLEKELGLSDTNITITPEFREVVEKIIIPMVLDNQSNYQYFTLWTIVTKAENKMVGDLCFKGLPDAGNTIEIGYGTYEDFRRNGYMTEAVGGMIEWARQQHGVDAITASTEKINLPSMQVLQKNHFVKTGESDDLFHWKLAL